MNSPIQRILVPLDPSEFTDAATHRACEVARQHFAQVEGVAILDSPEIRSLVDAESMSDWSVSSELVNRRLDEAQETIALLQQRFAGICEAERVAHSEVGMEGVPVQKILQAAALHDLIVTGLRTYFHFETRKGEGEMLTKLLDRTITPVLAVPAGPQAPYKRALIAYDGSFGAARALRDFALFAGPFDMELTVFTSHPNNDLARLLQDQALAFLRAHGFKRLTTETTQHPATEALSGDLVKDHDLIVLGIHARKFIKDAFVGSLAKRLIEDGNRALFLSH